MDNIFVCLPVFIREQPVDHYYKLSSVIYVQDYMHENIPIPGKCAVTLESFVKPIIADRDVSIFVKLGFLPIASKEQGSLCKSYINPMRIKSVREYLSSPPRRYMIIMDEINHRETGSKEHGIMTRQERPYTFITTDNIIPLLNTKQHLVGSST